MFPASDVRPAHVPSSPGPRLAGQGSIVTVTAAFKLFFGLETESADLDHLLHLLPASVFAYVEDEVCLTPRIQ